MDLLICAIIILFFLIVIYYQRFYYKKEKADIINTLKKRAHNFEELFYFKIDNEEITNMEKEKIVKVKELLSMDKKYIGDYKINRYGDLILLERRNYKEKISELEKELTALRKENKFNKDIEYYYSKEFVSKLTYILEEVNAFDKELGTYFNRNKVLLMFENIKHKIKFLIENFIENGSIEIREYKLNGVDELVRKLEEEFLEKCSLDVEVDIVNEDIYIEVDKLFVIIQTLIFSIIKKTASKIQLKLKVEVEGEYLLFEIMYSKSGVPFYEIFDEDFLETKRIKRRSWSFDISNDCFKLIIPTKYGSQNSAYILKTMIISSNLNHIGHVEDTIIADVKEKGYEKDSIKELKLVLDELLINAIEHGNRFDINKIVTINYYFGNEDELVITIEDQGEGFEIKHLKEPDFLSERGRGIFMIKRIVDVLEYSNEGKKVKIVKKKKESEIM